MYYVTVLLGKDPATGRSNYGVAAEFEEFADAKAAADNYAASGEAAEVAVSHPDGWETVYCAG